MHPPSPMRHWLSGVYGYDYAAFSFRPTEGSDGEYFGQVYRLR